MVLIILNETDGYSLIRRLSCLIRHAQAHSDRSNPRFPYRLTPEPFLIQPLCWCSAWLLHADAVTRHTHPQRPAACAQSAQLIKNKWPDSEWNENQQCAAVKTRPVWKHRPFPIFISCSRGMCMMLCLITTEEKDKYRNGAPPPSPPPSPS